jgi:two-component system sensor histidine kinase SenX3
VQSRIGPYAGRVQETWSLAVAGLIGLFVGVSAVLAFRASERVQRAVGELPAPSVSSDLAAVLGAMRAIAVIVGPADEVLRANPAAYAVGIVRGGRLVHQVTNDLVASVRRDGVTRDRELDVPRGPGESPGLLTLRLRVAGLPGDRVLVLADDETAARRLEEIRRDFVANVSHELKTPVGAISLLAETVLDSADDPDAVRRFTPQMQREVRRLSTLVQEIIDLSRLQGPNPLVDLYPVSIDDVVTEAVDRSRVDADARQVTLVVGGLRGLWVVGDEQLLITAVRNLIDNAISYSERGKRVGIGVSRRDGFVEIAVVDQGIGIAPEEIGRIFERFYRVDPARSRQTGGTGLGLSIVKHVAADHGGEVRVWSTPQRGSTFTLRLPEAEEAFDHDDEDEDVPAGARDETEDEGETE